MKPSDYVALTVHEISCEGDASLEAFTQFVVLRRWGCDEGEYGLLGAPQVAHGSPEVQARD
jgi:hypothetical protein